MKPRHTPLAVAFLAFFSVAPALAATPARMRGVCWEGAGRIDPTNLAPLRDLGVDWISQTPFGWAPSLTSNEIRFRSDGGLWGETNAGLVQTAAWARALGIKTFLKPHVWVRHGEWPGDIAMMTDDAWKEWFASYEAFILHYARLAEANGFESLATCRMLEASGRLIGMPVITGDCVSPVLARVCGMHLAYYHVVANWGTGLEPDDPTITLNRLYMETLPAVAATLELGFLDEVSEPAACRCRELLRARPPEYARALSPPAPK